MTFGPLGRAPLAPASIHRRRLFTSGKVGLVLVAISLAIGMAGYMALEDLDFVDAFVNASMILSGMGPLHNPESVAGKVFAGFYALYSGFAVIGIAAVIFAPVVHRMFHRLHVEDLDGQHGEDPDAPVKPSRKRPRAG